MGSSVRRMISGLVDRIKKEGAEKGIGDPTAMGRANSRIARIGLTERQRDLNSLWAWYRNQFYDVRSTDWNGDHIGDPVETETIASQGYVPPGFTMPLSESLPIKFRRPTAPYALPRVVVNRFTGLLFSEGHQPKVIVEGDPATEEWINAVLLSAEVWSRARLERTHGGAMGTSVIGFQVIDGKLELEVHDPRWCFPEFEKRGSVELKKLDKKYLYPEDNLNPETGRIETQWSWYRRVIDAETDTLWEPVPVGDGDEPAWDDLPNNAVRHGFGFVPVEWIQNIELQDDIDGDPDCEGIFDLVTTIDALLSQANKGTVKNADPTLVIATDGELPVVKKGSGTALQVPRGDSAVYLEIGAAGIKMAVDLAKELRALALEVVQCVLDHPEADAQKTATEVERVYSSMLQRAGDLRVQHGGAWRRLAEKIIRAAKAMEENPVADPVTGEEQVFRITVAPRVQTDEQTGEITMIPRELGPGGVVSLRWPPFFRPTLADITQAVAAAAQALTAGLIDEDHAVDFVAQFFGFEDTAAVRAKIKAEKAKRDAEQAAMVQQYMGGGR